MMNECKQVTGGVIAAPAPLFASSWAALFELLRGVLGKERKAVSVSDPRGNSTTRNRE
jgi:hypothetical protein